MLAMVLFDKFLISGLSIKWFRSVIVLNWRADVNREGGEDNGGFGMEEWTQIVVQHHLWVSLQGGKWWAVGFCVVTQWDCVWIKIYACYQCDDYSLYKSIFWTHGWEYISKRYWLSPEKWLRLWGHIVCLHASGMLHGSVCLFRPGWSVVQCNLSLSRCGHHSHRATSPLTMRGWTLLGSTGWNYMDGLTGFWGESLRKTPDYVPCPQDHHLSSDKITTWPACQLKKLKNSFHGDRAATSHQLHCLV